MKLPPVVILSSNEICVIVEFYVLSDGSKFNIGTIFGVYVNSVRLFWKAIKNWIDFDLFC